MVDIKMIILAAIAGGAGTLIGGTQTFIVTGFVGILVAILQSLNANITFLNDIVLNTFFLPCIIFNGAAFATAYASKKYPIKGTETYRSLAFTNDPLVILSGSLAGLLGYFIFLIANYLNLPVDIGSLSVFLVGVLGRILFADGKYYNASNIKRLKHPDWYALSYQLLLALMFSAATAYFTFESHLYTIGFSVSALSLIFSFYDPAFPATHHITLVTGYAIMQTQNIVIGICFGIISQIIFFLFAAIFNTDCKTHIDPPAVAIGICSFILFTFF